MSACSVLQNKTIAFIAKQRGDLGSHFKVGAILLNPQQAIKESM